MFSKSSTYAIRAVLYLAIEGSAKRKLGVKEIAEALTIPRPFLAKLLQQLSREGLITSVKGPYGGFFLSEENLQNSIQDILYCLDGEDMFSHCVLGLKNCSSQNPCPLHEQYMACKAGLQYQLNRQTIGELAALVVREQLQL